ncbi:MAG: C4-dicarboxylate ABC transporter [Rhodospirillaceae bacterium]|nr:C4-dicarboxylate ABC transporter [Rhodospirillaceae bacterium]HAA91870.1 C4-dicarboxylate ABC transporter [Rhodospirillaceae bacterium]
METVLPLLMFAALAGLLFTGYPVAFVLAGVAVLFGLIGMALDLFTFKMFFIFVPRIWDGIADALILTAIPMFIFMGTMLERSGVAGELLRCLQIWLRRVPGGLALCVVVIGTVMAATTGIIGASVVMMTLLALPVMLERGYDPRLSTGTIAASGTLGILIPPSIMLIFMAHLLQQKLGNLFVAAVIPGLLLASLYMVYIIGRCALQPKLAPPLPADERPASFGHLLIMSLVSLAPPLLLIFLVLGSILFGWTTPTEAAGVGAAGALFLAGIYKPCLNVVLGKTPFGDMDAPSNVIPTASAWTKLKTEFRAFAASLPDIVERTALTNAMLFMILIGATAFSFVFRALGGDDVILGIVEHLGLGSWGLLWVLMLLVFLLGFFFDWIEITLIVLPVFAPIIHGMDFGDHVARADMVYWFAILMAVNLQTSFLTPPFGFALFYLKGAAPTDIRMGDVYRGIVPFVALQLVGLGLIMAFPKIALWLPGKLLN